MLNLVTELKNIFGEDSQEANTVYEVYDIITSSAPTTLAEAKTNLILLDHARVKLSTIYFMIDREISRIRNSIQSTYDSQYVTLVKRGRPSKDAIESEIRVLNPEYAGLAYKMEVYNSVKDLVNMYLKCIDSSRMTTIELLRNIDRVD